MAAVYVYRLADNKHHTPRMGIWLTTDKYCIRIAMAGWLHPAGQLLRGK